MSGQLGTILEQEKKDGDKGQTNTTGNGKHKRMGGDTDNSKEEDPTQGADTIISYIGYGNIGKATTAIMSHGIAPVNEDTTQQVTELLIPMEPRPTWADAKANPHIESEDTRSA